MVRADGVQCQQKAEEGIGMHMEGARDAEPSVANEDAVKNGKVLEECGEVAAERHKKP